MTKINLWQWDNDNLEVICGTPFWKNADIIENWLQKAKLQYWRFRLPSTGIAGSTYNMICVWDYDWIKAQKLLLFVKNRKQGRLFIIPKSLEQYKTKGYWKFGRKHLKWVEEA